MQWMTKTFYELTHDELYRILKLRLETFIIEQQSIYLDIDDEDQAAIHFYACSDNEIATYARIQLYDTFAVIQRVIVHPNYRKQKLGKLLMSKTLAFIESLKKPKIELSAQTYLQKFYENLGFTAHGEAYLDGGIPHIKMVKKLNF